MKQEVNDVYCFFVVDFIRFTSRRKIIKHHVAGGTLEYHTCVQDSQHPRLGKPRRGLQILDTWMGFPGPSRNVVIDSISLGQTQVTDFINLALHLRSDFLVQGMRKVFTICKCGQSTRRVCETRVPPAATKSNTAKISESYILTSRGMR